MRYDPERHNRQSIRLPGYDYASDGAYFVTICTEARECILGDVVDGHVKLSPYGTIVREEWYRSVMLRAELDLDRLVIMPNHLDATVSILGDPGKATVGAHGRAPLLSRPPKSLGSFIAGFKAVTTKRINEARGTQGSRVWQRNYHEHIIRDGDELERIRRYIELNPDLWKEDPEHPDNATQPTARLQAHG